MAQLRSTVFGIFHPPSEDGRRGYSSQIVVYSYSGQKPTGTLLPIPGSARARSIAAHRRVEELRIMGAGDSPVNEVRKNSGNSTIAFER